MKMKKIFRKYFHNTEITIPEKYQQEITAGQIAYVFETIKLQLVVNPVIGLLLIFTIADLHQPIILSIWYLSLLTVIFSRYYLWNQYNQSDTKTRLSEKWGRQFTITNVGLGLVWGCSFVLFYSPDLPEYNALHIIVVAGFVAGSFGSHTAYISSYIAFSSLAVAPVIITLLIDGGKVNNILATFSMVFVFVRLFYASRAHKYYQQAMFNQLQYKDLGIEIKKQKQQLEEANRAKIKFLATSSHDLRQPLHALQLFVESLAKEPLSESSQRIVNNIEITTNALTRYFNNLLDYTRIEGKSLQPNNTVFPLSELLERLFIEYEQSALDKNLVLHIVPTSVSLNTDYTFLERIIRNLLSNAIRYTEKGKILMGCRRRGDFICIQVLDTGCGLNAQQAKEIFNEFHQINTEARLGEAGLGLGLSIADGLAKLIRAKIQVQSNQGKGSCFSICLPSFDHTNNSLSQKDIPTISDSSQLSCSLLVVSDDLSFNNRMRDAFSLWSPDGIYAETIEQALKMIEVSTVRVDVILLQAHHEIRGQSFNFIERIREKLGATIPVILIEDTPNTMRLSDNDIRIISQPISIKPAMLRLAIEDVISNS